MWNNYGHVQGQHAGYGQQPDQQQALYDYNAAQLELQLRQLQLRNLEIQSALFAQAQAQATQQQQPQYQQQQTSRQHSPVEEDFARRDALSTLERASRQRQASANASMNEGGFQNRAGSRLSFGSGNGVSLADRAMARRSQDVSGYQLPPRAAGVVSPPGPTLVLTGPGQAFPDTSPTHTPQARRAGHRATDSQSSSSSSASERSSGSDPQSFDSMATSVGSPYNNKLNPSASTFMPVNGVMPPMFMSSTPPPPVRVSRFTPTQSTTLALATRQPRGPVREEELPAMNFSARIRRQAVFALKKTRPSFVGVLGEVESVRAGSQEVH